MRLERPHFAAPPAAWEAVRGQALDLQDTLSPGATRLVGMTAAEISFAKASPLLAALAG